MRILLDELVDDSGLASGPPLAAAMAAAAMAIRAKPLSAIVKKGVELYPPTAVDDDDFLDILMKEKNPRRNFEGVEETLLAGTTDHLIDLIC